MTPLRNQMIRELELHRKAPGTIKQYVSAVAELARHYQRSPDLISIEEVRDFIHHHFRAPSHRSLSTSARCVQSSFIHLRRKTNFPSCYPTSGSNLIPLRPGNGLYRWTSHCRPTKMSVGRRVGIACSESAFCNRPSLKSGFFARLGC